MKQRFLWLGSALLAITLLLTACPSGSTAPTKGSLAVNVTPDGVSWTISGSADTNTGDKTLTDLEPGSYTISGSMTGYNDGSVDVTVEAGKEASATLTLTEKEKPPTVGTLSITVTPADATVTVTDPSNSSQSFNGSKDLTNLAAGTYKVSASKVGYLPSGDKSFDVEVGKTTSAAITLSEVPQAKPVAGVELSRFYDEWNKDFVTETEEAKDTNGKDVLLLAAQTEDSLCFDAVAVDAEGNPVAGAEISVQLTGNVAQAVVLKGCAINGTKPTSISTAATSLVTGEDGKATFTVVGTYGINPTADTPPNSLEPSLKVIVEASNVTADAVASAGLNSVWEEFKVWFYNIDHLHHFDDNKDVRTSERWDNVLTPTRENSFKNSVHEFRTIVWQKQPPLAEGFAPSSIDGIMRYTISGSGASKVQWGADCASINGLVCDDADGNVSIDLKPGVTLEDLPVEVDVTAVLTVRVNYGPTYRFQLKKYTFKKRWTGAFLTIDKRIDHHVVTWKGPSHTLAQQGAYSDPWIATYTITVKNDSQQTARNVTVTDAIQPELGYVTGSAGPEDVLSVNYDSILHQLTWVIGDLDPGDSKEVTFSVYARQKPGFCWEQGAYFYSRRPAQANSIADAAGGCANPYSDPYNAVNGEYKDDVTAEAEDIDPVDYEPGVDDVILYVVRPLFRLDKYIKLPDGSKGNFITVLEDDNVEYGFRVTNVDRYSELPYKNVQDKYTSYNNTAGDAVRDFGADSDPAAMKWANPYGSEITLVDWFDEGLDYDTSAGGTWSAASPKFVSFESEDLVNYKQTVFADYELALTASEPTADRSVPADGVIDGWINCAYMDAQNLNQPRHDHTAAAPFWDWWDAQPGNVDHPWHAIDNMHQIDAIAAGNPPHTDAEPAAYSPNVAGNINHPGFTGTAPTNVTGDLEDCVVVYVNPRTDSRILTLSTIKEHAPASLAMTPAAFALANETDPVAPGNTYWYYFLVNAASTNSANVDNIDFETSLVVLNGMSYTGNYRVMEAASNGGQWPTFAWADTGLTAVVASPTITFAEYNGLQSNHYLLYAVEVTAGAGAVHTIDGDVVDSNADNQATIATVTEQTQIAP